jgi:phosphoribosylformimino-5-aminoimidazole carboxamide ribotide isomerase
MIRFRWPGPGIPKEPKGFIWLTWTALWGKRVNGEVIKKIASSVPVPLELGGGIRNLASIEFYLEAGVQWVILGTAACKDPKLVEEACRRFPGRVMLAIDARAGRVAVEGWTEDTNVLRST